MRGLQSTWLLLIALFAGAAVMILEVAAPRLAAPHVGTSALVWTVVIANDIAVARRHFESHRTGKGIITANGVANVL